MMTMQGVKSTKSLQGSVPVKEIVFELIVLFIKSLLVATVEHKMTRYAHCRYLTLGLKCIYCSIKRKASGTGG